MYYTDKVNKPFHTCNAHTEHYKDAELFLFLMKHQLQC